MNLLLTIIITIAELSLAVGGQSFAAGEHQLHETDSFSVLSSLSDETQTKRSLKSQIYSKTLRKL